MLAVKEISKNHQAACIYTALGWPVIPIWPIREGACACGQDCGKSAGKHPIGHLVPKGIKNATCEAKIVDDWWQKYPDANVAIATGEPSGVFVVDIDPKNGGDVTWDELEMQNGRPDTVEQETGSGGTHFFFKHLPGLGNSSNRIRPGIDTRGDGGYVLMPPSNHLSGNTYTWELSSHPQDQGLAEIPDWLLQLLESSSKETVEVVFDNPSSDKPDLGQFKLSKLIRQTILHGPNGAADRSAIDQSVITALVGAQASDDEILAVFQHYPIGTAGKFAEKGKNALAYLSHSIANARGYVAEQQGKTAVSTSANVVGAKTAVFSEMPPLPESAVIDPALGNDACQWLDDYVAFSGRMSPRGYDGFHEAVGVWILSTIAARRLLVGLGTKRFYTNLNIALCAFTTIYAKTTTARVGLLTLEKAGLSYLLAPNDSTPQAFINLLTGSVPADYGKLSSEAQAIERQCLRFPAQKGWFYEEFGTKVKAMMKEGGFMADFRGILRALDDNPSRYEYRTVTRRDVVKRPYLALLVNMTPADIKPFARQGAALWHDGFWARWVFVTPPIGEDLKYGRFPDEEINIPPSLLEPLREWHQRLGVPNVLIEEKLNEKGESTGHYILNRDEIEPTSCSLGDGVIDAFYAYQDGLIAIAKEQVEMGNADLVGNYGRFGEKAMRVAILLGSLSNGNRVEMTHWARGQGMAERWRSNLHNLAAEVSRPSPSEENKQQEQVISALIRHGPSTAAQIARDVRSLSSPEMISFCDQLVKAGVLQVIEKTRSNTNRYGLVDEE